MKMQNYFADTEKQIMKNRSMTNTIDYARLGILVMDKARFLHSTGNSATLAIQNALEIKRSTMEISSSRKWRMFEAYCWAHWQSVINSRVMTMQGLPTADAAAFDKVIVNMTAQIKKEK